MTIVDVSPSSQMSPTMIRTKPTSSHDAKPVFLSHVGAANCSLLSDTIVQLLSSPYGELMPRSLTGARSPRVTLLA